MDQSDLGLSYNQGSRDNVTDWALEKFQNKYGPQITKGDIWFYLYGVMHATDWRKKHQHDLQRELPRIPLANNFVAFRDSGEALMNLHANYETGPEAPIDCLVDGRLVIDGQFAQKGLVTPPPRALDEAFRLKKLKLTKTADDDYQLSINERCRLIKIPLEVENYTISGRSPLKWAIESLTINRKKERETGVVDDPNSWERWQNEPFELIRHLRRLIHLSLESDRIINNLPNALD